MYSLETIVLDYLGTEPKITVKRINAFILDIRKYTALKYIFDVKTVINISIIRIF